MTYLAWIGIVVDTITLGLLAVQFREWRRLLREQQHDAHLPDGGIDIVLRERGGRRSYTLPLPLRRRDVTRSEVMGRIGCIPRHEPSKNYTIRYTNSFAFVQQILNFEDPAYNGPRRIEVWCSPGREMEQFDVKYRIEREPQTEPPEVTAEIGAVTPLPALEATAAGAAST